MNLYRIFVLGLFIFVSASYPCGTLYEDNNSHRRVAISPNGAYLATADWSNSVALFKVSNGAISSLSTSWLAESMTPNSVAFSPNNDLVAVVASIEQSWNGTVALFVVSNGELSTPVFYNVPSPSSNPLCATFSPNGAYLAVANGYPNTNGTIWTNDVTIFKVAGSTLTDPVSYLSPSQVGPGFYLFPLSIAFSPDGSILATGNWINGQNPLSTGTISVFNVNDDGSLNAGTSYALPEGSAGPVDLVFSPNGSLLATAHPQSNSTTLYSVSQGVLKTGTSYTGPSLFYTYAVAFSPNNALLACTNAENDGVTVFEVTNVLSNATSYESPHYPYDLQQPFDLTFSKDGKFLFVANMAQSFTIFDTTSWCSNPTRE